MGWWENKRTIFPATHFKKFKFLCLSTNHPWNPASHNSFMNCSVAMDVMAEPRSPAETDGPQSWKHLPPDLLPKCLLTLALLHRACEAFQDMDCPSSCHSREPLPQLCLWKSSNQAPSAARLWGGDITTKSQLWHSQTAQPSNGIVSHTI